MYSGWMVVWAGAEGVATLDERKQRAKKEEGEEEGSCQLLQGFEWLVVQNQVSGGRLAGSRCYPYHFLIPRPCGMYPTAPGTCVLSHEVWIILMSASERYCL